jgi:hypothetical protein
MLAEAALPLVTLRFDFRSRNEPNKYRGSPCFFKPVLGPVIFLIHATHYLFEILNDQPFNLLV